MRILQIIPTITLLDGGPSKAVPALCESLAHLGHIVELWTTDYMLEPEQHGLAHKKIHNEFSTRIFPSKKLFGILYSQQLLNSLKKAYIDFDLVHVNSLWNPIASSTMNILRKLNVPYCISPHGMLDPVVISHSHWKKLLWGSLWERANIEEAGLLHWTSDTEYEKARSSGWRFNSSVVMPIIINIEEWNNLPSPLHFETLFPSVAKKDMIFFAGRINWVKNIDLLIKALAIVREKRPSAMLVCAGPDNDNYQPELVKIAASLGLKDSVLFTGMLNADTLKAAYARAQVFALVSKKENFGMAAAEALASGLPVVLSEGVDMGKEWPAYDFIRRVKEDPAAIASGLLAMLERTSRVGTPDPSARALAAAQWGLSSTEKLVDAYKEMLNS